MSDGPHKTLNMRRAWKRLTERADKAANRPAEVMECVVPAISQDWIGETTPGYLQEVAQVLGCGIKPLLFPKDPAELARLRQGASSSMEALLAGHAIDACHSNKSGPQALQEVIRKTLCEWAVRATLQAEEHYQRESTFSRARQMRGRLQRAITAAGPAITNLSLSITQGTKLPTRAPAKHSGLEEGPSL